MQVPTWKMRMPPENVATAETMTSKSREMSGCKRLSWYSAKPPAMRLMPSRSAGLKSTFTMARVSRARALIDLLWAVLAFTKQGCCDHLHRVPLELLLRVDRGCTEEGRARRNQHVHWHAAESALPEINDVLSCPAVTLCLPMSCAPLPINRTSQEESLAY